MTVQKFLFPANPELTGYKIFPADLEDDPHVFFHGTAKAHLASILQDGFKPKPPLESVSFATDSGLPLRYACEARSEDSPNGCVIAVRYEELDQCGLDLSFSLLHDRRRKPSPTIIGFCIVPAAYVHI